MQRWSKLRRNKCLNHLHLWGTEPLVRVAQTTSENGGTPPTVASVCWPFLYRWVCVRPHHMCQNSKVDVAFPLLACDMEAVFAFSDIRSTQTQPKACPGDSGLFLLWWKIFVWNILPQTLDSWLIFYAELHKHVHYRSQYFFWVFKRWL